MDRNVGYNIESGGRGAGRLSDDTKAKIAKANLGRKDSISRRKRISGENHPNSKLTWDIVDRIRSDYADGNISQKELASKYELNSREIQRIVRFKRWVLRP